MSKPVRGPTRNMLLLDSGLRRASGHHQHFAEGFARAAHRRGWHTSIYAHRGLNDEIVGGFETRAVFRHSLYDRLSPDPYEGTLCDYAPLSKTFAEDLLGAATPRGPALVLLPTATPAELAGIALWLAGQPEPPRLAAIFHWGDVQTLSRGTLAAALLRRAAKALVAARPADIWFGATHASLAAALGEVLVRPINIVPSLTFFETSPLSESPRDALDTVTLIVPGAPRAAKGSAVMRDLAIAAWAERLPVRFIVQAGDDTDFSASMVGLPGVSVFDGWLHEAALTNAIDGADAALLPYDKRTYSQMVSGVFTLVSGRGRPSLVPEGTWLSERLAAGEAAGLTFRENNVADLLNTIRRFLLERAKLQEQAAARAETWRNAYSAELLVDRLLEWASLDR